MRILIGVTLLLGVAACGGEPNVVLPIATGPIAAPVPGPGLAAWESFPVHQVPRPIVLTRRPPMLAGFSSDEGKLAAVAGSYEVTGPLPDAPPTVTAELPDGPAEFRTLPAEAALAGLRAAGSGAGTQPAQPLRIQKVELGTATFGTDRGGLALPAWLFHSDQATGPIAWPALPDEAFWKAGATVGGPGPARLGPDGTLTLSLPAPAPPCPGEQPQRAEPVVTETDTAVAVTIRFDPPQPAGDCIQDAMLRFTEYQVRLGAPLGNRVLVDDQGAPIAVTP
ncbi:MAG TPA: hypothetical protein VFV67_16220 [Actinophytocola sp.]|uniref:hypothetical protein n=1 Tax=Actinophytocola sp. TaxID=1872138 RepID=UPI002DBB3F08|nr:hypothetical protein [Actinophytocola sp.]HEU5472200.1 hypothetical protein [Actinophytocola sp.]